MTQTNSWTRRRFVSTGLGASAWILAAGALPRAARAGVPDAARAGLGDSRVIYLSPLRSGGDLSKCQAEIWFVADGDDVLVVTRSDAWRARAIGQGLDHARIWVGDFGVWTKAEGRYLKAPSYLATASRVHGGGAHARALTLFGKKYADDWAKWGPRFQQGLASGDRALLRYQPE